MISGIHPIFLGDFHRAISPEAPHLPQDRLLGMAKKWAKTQNPVVFAIENGDL